MDADAAWERHVPLEGGLNLRDLGGYPTLDGREVRRGCLYRSAELCSLTDADHATLAELGVRIVFDLRNEHERGARPGRLPSGVELLERTSPGTVDGGSTIEEQIAAGTLPDADDEYMAGIYLALLDEVLVPELRRIVELAVDAHDRPILFHCVAGKDRTGIAAALLLGLLGVDDRTIVADYELSREHWTTARLAALAPLLAEHGVADDRVRPFLDARLPAMERLIGHVAERWGGYEGYAVDRLGVDAALPDRLRTTLTA